MRSEVAAVYKPLFSRPLFRPLVGCRVAAGFPSPAEDYIEGRLDLNKFLVRHPVATFYIRVRGDSMEPVIRPGELLVVDRAAQTCDGHIVVARVDDELCIKRLRLDGRGVWLVPENKAYEPFEVTDAVDFEVWGRVMHSIQSF